MYPVNLDGCARKYVITEFFRMGENVLENIAAAASVIINNYQNGGNTQEEFLNFFGTCFVRYTLSNIKPNSATNPSIVKQNNTFKCDRKFCIYLYI